MVKFLKFLFYAIVSIVSFPFIAITVGPAVLFVISIFVGVIYWILFFMGYDIKL